jgi:two-component system sensor histidine kinase HydH
MFFQWMKRSLVYGPSWMIIGISLVLMAVILFMGGTNYHRSKASIEHLLREKGDVLIRSFEAGTKTGMMGMMGDEAHLQKLLEETAARADVAFIALVDKDGAVLAHSDAKLIGTIAKAFIRNETFAPTDKSQWRTTAGAHEETLFEVYRDFLPAPPPSGHMGSMGKHHDLSCVPGWIRGMSQERILDPNNRPAIVIGMNSTPYEAALTKDIWTSLVTAGTVLLLAITGVVSLFWAQSYMNSRKLLRDIRTFASEIVKNIPVGMVVIGGDGRIMFMNEQACSLLGISLEGSNNALARIILPEHLLRLRENQGSGSSVVAKECNLARTDGTTTPMNVSATNIVGEEGQYIGFMYILQDLTEQRRLELNVRQREKLAAIGNLAAGIAHEIRNPLSSIKGYVTYFGSLFEEGSENRKAAGIMVGEVDRVNRVISELLEFARPSDLKLQKTDIRELIDHSLRVVAHEAEFARVHIAKAFKGTLPELTLDPDRITQVLLNLLINAIQAMPAGGELTLTDEQEENLLLLHITDTGEGIAPENLADLFNPYFTTKKNGTGLGLAIVHKIVEDHGGTMRIRSKLEVGTTVTIVLPMTLEA